MSISNTFVVMATWNDMNKTWTGWCRDISYTSERRSLDELLSEFSTYAIERDRRRDEYPRRIVIQVIASGSAISLASQLEEAEIPRLKNAMREAKF